MSAREPGDWRCLACNSPSFNFKKRTTCRNCNAPRFANNDRQVPKKEEGDWMCMVCNDSSFNFKSRTTCRRCNATRQESIAAAAAIAASKLEAQEQAASSAPPDDASRKCIICMDADKEVVLPCGHYDMCDACARKMVKCGLCKAPYDVSKILRVFES